MDTERSSLRLGVRPSLDENFLFPTDACRKDRKCCSSVLWCSASVGDPDAGRLCSFSFGEVGNACDFHWLPPRKGLRKRGCSQLGRTAWCRTSIRYGVDWG